MTTVAVPTTRLVEVADQSEVDPAGAIVKLRPTLRASERASWSGAEQAASLRARGAVAVLLAPRVVPDEGRLTEVARAGSPEAAVRAWFDALPGSSPEDRAAALETALSYVAAES